jgi:hypothetical protein
MSESMADEIEPWAALQMRNPAFARAYYKPIYSEPLPLRIDGHAYHRRQKRRKR